MIDFLDDDAGPSGAHRQHRGDAHVETGDVLQGHLRERVAQQRNACGRLRRRHRLLLRRPHRRYSSDDSTSIETMFIPFREFLNKKMFKKRILSRKQSQR